MEVPAPGASGHRSSNQVPRCIRARARSDGDTNICKAIDFHNKLCKGHGANFIQWARGGASAWFKVTEMRADSGQWYPFLACRHPQELDDEIKQVPLEWHRAYGQLATQQSRIAARQQSDAKQNNVTVKSFTSFSSSIRRSVWKLRS